MIVLTAAAASHRVAIVGATHGNEYTGAYVLEQLAAQQQQLAQDYPALQVDTVLANERALAENPHIKGFFFE